jgi:DNA polymerase-3 subunit beta
MTITAGIEQTFSVAQQELITILAATLPICTKRTTIDATASLFIQIRQRELIIKSTDLEVALQASCTLEDSTINEGAQQTSFLVIGKRLHDIVKELDGIIECTLAQGTLTLRANGVVVQLNTADSNQFPPFPERIENLMHIDTPLLIEILKSVTFVIPQQHASHALTGLLWESGPHGIVLTGTDGHCLAQAATPQGSNSEKQQWLIPRRAALELQKLLDLMPDKTIFIGTCGKHMVFSSDVFNFFIRQLAGQYPQYNAIMRRDDFIPARIERQQMIKALRRSASLLSGKFIATEFTFAGDCLEVALTNKEVGSLHEEVKLDHYEGASLSIRCYAPYILHGLQAFADETHLQLFIKSPQSPLIFVNERANKTHMTYLVMPVAGTQ